MTSTLDEGARACALERYLSGEAEAPRRGAFPFAPAALLLAARYGRSIPSLRTAAAVGEDVRIVGVYRALKLAFDSYAHEVKRNRREAEQTLAVQFAAAFDQTLVWLREGGFRADFSFDYTDEQQASDEHLRLLAGVLALSLWEAGHPPAREYIRGLLPDLLGEPNGWRYVRASVGMAEDVHAALDWRPGRGALGSLSNALLRGGRLIEDAYVGAPEPAPAWATAAKAKAAEEKTAQERLESGPSLLVLASVEHLPGAAKSGESRPGGLTGSTVRAEWAPFAGRAWSLLPVPDLRAAREILVGEFPYAEAVIDAVLRDLSGRPHVFIRPLLLVGNPGCGKTRLARRIAEVLGLGFQICSLSGTSDSALIGTSRQWSTYRASTPLQLLKRLSMACAAVIADEIDKTATSKHNGSALDGLLPFLTPDACRIVDPALECPVDLSAVSWIATANDLDGLRRDAPALLDRFKVYTVPDPRREHLPALLRGVMTELRAERGLDEHWMPDLAPDEAELVEAHWRGGSVRGVRRLAEAVLAGREALATRM
ncbi:ATPase family associated with various cellular activities (AAA) [Methylobacterium sp. ap11]|uniref:AAA family ATPase n=1 Tax=Methylobacterium sp. ap11 TaxID=1761799 RepID=UPI0008C1C8C9|nr:AAA family ATPase [Methylobacterium sp. ap11]SEO94217.1 ATPase family associated with various cellular activities (AAA) [Methylobacterium sp. ap11]